MEVRAGPPPSAPGVHVTRQRGAATGRAHPAAAAPGPSRVEVRRDRRREDPRARPGEAAWAEGAGAAPGGPWRVQGACLHVWGRQGGVGPRASACGCLGARACCRGTRVGSAPVLVLLAGLGVCGTVRARACLCGGAPGVYLRMRWAVIVPGPGAGRGPAPAQPLLRGYVFQTGFLRRWALLQP